MFFVAPFGSVTVAVAVLGTLFHALSTVVLVLVSNVTDSVAPFGNSWSSLPSLTRINVLLSSSDGCSPLTKLITSRLTKS